MGLQVATLNVKDVFDCQENLTNNISLLNGFIQKDKLYLSDLKGKGGIYAFWWCGEKNKLINAFKDCDYRLKGKKSETKLLKVIFTKEWAEKASFDNKVCLYVGKSTDIKGRISKHIKLQTKDIWTKNGGVVIDRNQGIKPNTESQLRTGLERLFNQSIFDGLIENIGISWILLDEYQNGVNRFYLEDYYIGKYFPLFNIDIER